MHRLGRSRTFEEFPVIDSHTHDATDETEILHMFFIEDSRERIDLKSIVVSKQGQYELEVGQQISGNKDGKSRLRIHI